MVAGTLVPKRTDDPLHSRRCRTAKFGIYLLLILSLLEGALRKWLLPDLAGPLTLLRDPLVLALYLYCFSNGLVLRNTLSVAWLSFAAFSVVLGIFQFNLGNLPIAGLLLGVRSYWLYMPLAFIIPSVFRRGDVVQFLRFQLWISIPYAALVINQYNAGGDAFINAGVQADGGNTAVMLNDNVLRPFGMFTYTGPNVQYTVAMVATLLAVYLSTRHDKPKPVLLFVMALSTGAMVALSGSRAIYFQVPFLVCLAAAGLAGHRMMTNRLLTIAIFTVVSALLSLLVFQDMYAAMLHRFASAAVSEGSIGDRISTELLQPFDSLFSAPLFGEGIGAGAPGVARFIGLPDLPFGEQDLGRNINELGIFFGLLMVALRFGTALWIFLFGLRLARSGEPIALPLVGFVLLWILVGQLTHSPQNSFLPWLYLGLVIALKRPTNIRNIAN